MKNKIFAFEFVGLCLVDKFNKELVWIVKGKSD